MPKFHIIFVSFQAWVAWVSEPCNHWWTFCTRHYYSMYGSFNWIEYSKYEYAHFQCIPISGLYWCQCISNRMSMHHTKKHFLAWSIDQISVSPIINHHGHYPSYCRRHVGVNQISQGTLREILDELHLRPLASYILKDALIYVNASSIHTCVHKTTAKS